MPLGAALISGVANIAGGLISGKGVSEQNSANARMARKQMQFQRHENRKAMSFSRKMSNTSYQRGMRDMRKAGLNPILAYKQGGASEPSGVTSAGAMARMENESAPLGEGVKNSTSAYLQAKTQQAQIANIEASTQLSLATSALTAEKIGTEQAQQNNLNSNSALSAQRTLTEINLTEQQRINIETAVANLGIADSNWTIRSREAALAEIERSIDQSGYGKTILWLRRLKDAPNPLNLLLKGMKKK